jgi:hypothetical protein
MQALVKFLEGNDVSMRCRELPPNVHDASEVAEPWAAKHYLCELRGSDGGRPITTVVGSDNGPPEIVDVLDVLAAEAAVAEEAGSFEAWADRLGYDPDSRNGERAYRNEVRRGKLLRALLGEDSYRRLLWETERL